MTTNIIQTDVGAGIDTNRIYLYGVSIGGTGTLQLGLKHPGHGIQEVPDDEAAERRSGGGSRGGG